MNREEFEYMKEALTTDLAELLVNNYHMSAIEALDVLYTSDTYAKLRDPQTGLYFQSSLYVYSLLENELATGSMG
jgi:hypothetical protein